MLGLGTCCHPAEQFSDVLEPFTGLPMGETELSPFGGGVNGAGSVGTLVDPVTWNIGVIGVAEQAFCGQPTPNAPSRLASRL
jgi:hypothetical protein